MSGAVSLLETVQALLERTYRMRTGLSEVGRFVIGDEGYRRLYRDLEIVTTAGTAPGEKIGARTLVRETPEGIRACIYYPDDLIRCLESHPPQRGLREANVDAFAALVEELDHLLCIAERARDDRPLTLLELELHANVSKHLVLARFLSAPGRPLDERRRVWLSYQLFHKGTFRDEDVDARARYRDAARFALRLLETLMRLPPAGRIEILRRFHAATASAKLELILGLAA
ncbi:MAG: hypothetical protein LAO51_01260 [Acidobacteriia bacterium]|nr:hypothetical protein [Terriglobia bacterium]